eukprot:COSAG02_NODE_1267_length_13538_cov_11.820746_8_plen_784_part_00
MGDTAWLGMDVTMDKIYAQQFDFIRGLIAKCGAEFLQIHEHLARHDLYGEQIVQLQLQAEEAARKHEALQESHDALVVRVDDVPRQIQAAVAQAEARMEQKMDVMRTTISQQAHRIEVMESIEAHRAEHTRIKKEKKKEFWAAKRPSVMAHMRGVKSATGLTPNASTGEEGVPPPAAAATGENGPIGGYPDHDHVAATDKMVVRHNHEDHHVSIEHLDTLVLPEHEATAVAHAAHSLSSEVKKVTVSAAVAAAASVAFAASHSAGPPTSQGATAETLTSAGVPTTSDPPSAAAPPNPSQPTASGVAAVSTPQGATAETLTSAGVPTTSDAPSAAVPPNPSQPTASGVAAVSMPLVGSGSGVVIPPATGEHTTFLSSEWSTEYLDTHDEHEANLHQWMEDTDAVIHTQARQISVLSKTTSIQKLLLKLQQDKTVEIEGKLDPLIETMKSVQETLDQLPEIQEKLGALENGLEQTEAIVDGLRTQLEEAVRKIEQDSMLLKELHEWRDGYIEEQEGKHTKTSAALETLRSEVDEEMEALKKAFADAQEMLDKFDLDAIENMVDQAALKDAMTDIMALMEQQIATRGSKQDIKDLEEQLAKIAELAAQVQDAPDPGASNDAMEALKEGLLLVESRMGSKADMEEMMALKAAIKKLAAARTGGSAGSLTTKSVSMCLACNRPIYQSNEVQKSGSNSRMGPGNSSIMAERNRQTGVYKLDVPSEVDRTLGMNRSQESSYSRERPRSVPTPMPMATANLSQSASQSSLSAAPTFLPSLPPRGVSRGSNR